MKTPAAILEKFEQAATGIDYGSVSLTLHMKRGAARYVIQKEESFLPTDDLSAGSGSFSIEGIEKKGQRENEVRING